MVVGRKEGESEAHAPRPVRLGGDGAAEPAGSLALCLQPGTGGGTDTTGGRAPKGIGNNGLP